MSPRHSHMDLAGLRGVHDEYRCTSTHPPNWRLSGLAGNYMAAPILPHTVRGCPRPRDAGRADTLCRLLVGTTIMMAAADKA
jgi:hypothetical protein